MPFNIDVVIIIAFLIINLVVGLYSGRGITTIKEYAIGNSNFSTTTLVATIVATWIGGGFFESCISETYKHGLLHIIIRFGDGLIGLLVIGYILVPKMQIFMNKNSVIEVIGELYTTRIRIICAVFSMLLTIAFTAAQIKLLSILFYNFLDLPNLYATLISSLIIITYSCFGGVKSVTFTDIVQFFAFGVFIPTFALLIFSTIGGYESVINVLTTHQIFDYNKAFNLGNHNFYNSLLMLFLFTIAAFDPVMLQRVALASSINQAQQSFIKAGIVCAFITIISISIGIMALAYNPNLNPDNIMIDLINHFSYPGLKVLTLMGIAALAMSTADSYIVSGAVIFSNDFCKPLGLTNIVKNDLLLARLFVVFGGAFAIIIALLMNNLFSMILLMVVIFIPTVTPLLLLTIFGFRTSERVILIGMLSGISSLIIWKIYIQSQLDVDGTIIAAIINMISILSAHYLLNEPGGWIVNKNSTTTQKIKIKNRSLNFLRRIKNLSSLRYYKNNLPKYEMAYIYFAFGVLITLIMSFSIDKSMSEKHIYLINLLQGTLLFISTSFICHGLWAKNLKEKYIGIIWYIAIFIGLAFINCLLVLLSKFSQISLVIFILNLATIGILINWQIALVMIILALTSSLFVYQQFIDTLISHETYDLKSKIIFLILIFISFLIAFLKPKQEQVKLTEEKVEHLGIQINDREEELEKLLELKDEFLCNIQHEVNTPITGIISLAQALDQSYDKFNAKQRRMAIKSIAASSERFNSLISNLLDLSKLSSLTYELHKTEVNLSELVYQRLDYCKKLYLNNEEREFLTNVEPDLIVNCDAHYITSTIDNLIINAIKYSSKGSIIIALKQSNSTVEFSITDEGVGIPQHELHNIFGAFVVGSRTRTKSGGIPNGQRGVGLALCEKVIKAHGGTIRAESSDKKGTSFKFTLSLHTTN
ncbi:sodium:solute symporter family transporter [Candidatus Trichorickettsia mobilis]|uniref:sodium:solute symporter family transporter n=1 Tax=Candidatus Trichorickettsia mobilis TaxID=1346319 RepID=UPI00292DA5B7|nr:ATP-binding protein [Candidatus Trichorickettsia mobilis]